MNTLMAACVAGGMWFGGRGKNERPLSLPPKPQNASNANYTDGQEVLQSTSQ